MEKSKACGGHALRIAVGMMVLGLLLAGSANAATLKVCSSGCSYSSIQKAINASSNGDTILVHSGTYSENVKVNKKLILRGIGNPVVDAGGRGSAITLSANGITLEGFVTTGGEGGYRYQTPGAGIRVTSNNNTLSGNNASNNYFYGIYFDYSSNNTMIGNNVSYNGYFGIYLSSSSNNTLNDNNASNNYEFSIYLRNSRNNMLNGNNASNNYYGISLFSSSNNTLRGNNVSNNFFNGIELSSSSNNTLSDNMMTGNQRNFDIYGDVESDFDNHIDTDNLVDGKPIYYIIKASATTYDSSSNAGTFYCISCENVTIKNLNLNRNSKGIYFWNTSQSRIQNVNASNNGYGIYLSSSSNNTITGNNASSNNDNGISLEDSSNYNIMSDNNANSNTQRGISLENSSNNNTISGNNASNNFIGISLYDSNNNNTISGNNASNNDIGIDLSSSSNNTMSDNMMTGNQENFNLDGDVESDFDNHIDTDNLVDGRLIYLIIKASDTKYDSSSNAGTFYCISCVNVTIKNLNVNKNSKGIYFWNTSQSKIQNVNASNNGYGIYLSHSSNNTLIRNNASSNNDNGIFLEDSSNNMLSDNNALKNENGISLSSSSKNTLTRNNASNNKNLYGISLSSSNKNTMNGNNASNNDIGIDLSSSKKNKMDGNNASSNDWNGISLFSSSNNTLRGNNASSNNGDGILLFSSSKNTLTRNNASNNVLYGISLYYSSNTKIYNNIFKNTKNFYFSDSNINFWNTTRQSGTNIISGPYLGGNFWANPKGTGFSQTCPDVNKDGICDSTYLLDSNNIDYLPLARFTTAGITVVSPNGGQNWYAGTTKKIKWKYTGNPGSRVKIDLLKGKKKIGTINSNVSIGKNGSGSYKWSIKSTQQPGNYKIRITSKSNPIYKDKSNKNFTILPQKSNGTIKIASFNLQIFGVTKAGKPEVMDVLSKTIRNFDIVAVQEIRDASQTALPALKNAVNSIDGPQYDYIVGERLGRTISKEQYAYIYNTQKIELMGIPYTYPEPAGNDMFHREPYVSEFKAKNGNFDFVLITIHTDPDTATQEINDLPKVVDDAKSRYPDEGDFIIAGDLNADCSSFDEDSSSPLRSSDYLWVINNNIDTTTKATNCTYDRIIITPPAITDYTHNSDVFRFDEVFNLNYNSTVAVSDHYPVFAEFWNNSDRD